MNNLLENEIREKLNNFFANVSNEEFWNALKEADKGVYGKIEVPIVEMQKDSRKDFSIGKDFETPFVVRAQVISFPGNKNIGTKLQNVNWQVQRIESEECELLAA
jgi:hypothetical protein